MGSSPTARTTSERISLRSDVFFAEQKRTSSTPLHPFLLSKPKPEVSVLCLGGVCSAPFAPPFKSEPAALGFGFVFLCWRLGGGKFRRLFLRSKKGRHPLRYIRSSFQTRSRRLRVCVLGGVCFASFVSAFNPKPEAWGLGWCVLGFAAVIFFYCSEEGFAVFGGLDLADAGDVEEFVHAARRSGGHIH